MARHSQQPQQGFAYEESCGAGYVRLFQGPVKGGRLRELLRFARFAHLGPN
jgi:hypothetical protein